MRGNPILFNNNSIFIIVKRVYIQVVPLVVRPIFMLQKYLKKVHALEKVSKLRIQNKKIDTKLLQM